MLFMVYVYYERSDMSSNKKKNNQNQSFYFCHLFFNVQIFMMDLAQMK